METAIKTSIEVSIGNISMWNIGWTQLVCQDASDAWGKLGCARNARAMLGCARYARAAKDARSAAAALER